MVFVPHRYPFKVCVTSMAWVWRGACYSCSETPRTHPELAFTHSVVLWLLAITIILLETAYVALRQSWPKTSRCCRLHTQCCLPLSNDVPPSVLSPFQCSKFDTLPPYISYLSPSSFPNPGSGRRSSSSGASRQSERGIPSTNPLPEAKAAVDHMDGPSFILRHLLFSLNWMVTLDLNFLN